MDNFTGAADKALRMGKSKPWISRTGEMSEDKSLFIVPLLLRFHRFMVFEGME